MHWVLTWTTCQPRIFRCLALHPCHPASNKWRREDKNKRKMDWGMRRRGWWDAVPPQLSSSERVLASGEITWESSGCSLISPPTSADLCALTAGETQPSINVTVRTNESQRPQGQWLSWFAYWYVMTEPWRGVLPLFGIRLAPLCWVYNLWAHRVEKLGCNLGEDEWP